MIFLSALILPIISFLVQSYPRFLNRYFGVDVWKRMIEIDLVRKNGHKIPMGIVKDGSLIKGYFDNPPIFPWLLSFIPKKKLVEIQGFIAPIFDCIHNLLIFGITYYLTGRVEIALLSQLIYASIPIINIENSYLTPRSLGYLNFTLAFFPLLLYSITPNPLYLITSFIFTVLLFFVHRFALQSLLFIGLIFTILDRNLIYVLLFTLAFISAIIVSKGYYFRVLEGHLFIIFFWVKNQKYRFAHQIRGLKEEKKKMDFVNFVYFLLSKFAPITLVATNLWLIIPFTIFISNFYSINLLPGYNSALILKLSIWVVFFYFMSASVLSIKYLLPIGEGQRYLEMATAPTAILASLFFFQYLNTGYKNLLIIIFTLIFIFNLLTTLYAQWKGVVKDKTRTLTKGMDQIFKFINSYHPSPRVLCIPHQLCGIILFNTHAKVLSDTQLKGALQISDVYPILKSPIKEIAKKHKLNLLVLKNTYASYQELNLKKSDLLIESEDTQIFKIG